MSRFLFASILSCLTVFVPVLGFGQIVDLCGSSAVSNGGCLVVCPEGDGERLSDVDAAIDVTVVYLGDPVPNIPAADIWLIACNPVEGMVLCGGSSSSNADGPTDPLGRTSISGPIAAGGCSDGLAVVVQGVVLPDEETGCGTWICLPINARSPDIDGNLIVGLPDLALFAMVFNQVPPDPCADFNCDGHVGLQDLAVFAAHFSASGHSCGP